MIHWALVAQMKSNREAREENELAGRSGARQGRTSIERKGVLEPKDGSRRARESSNHGAVTNQSRRADGAAGASSQQNGYCSEQIARRHDTRHGTGQARAVRGGGVQVKKGEAGLGVGLSSRYVALPRPALCAAAALLRAGQLLPRGQVAHAVRAGAQCTPLAAASASAGAFSSLKPAPASCTALMARPLRVGGWGGSTRCHLAAQQGGYARQGHLAAAVRPSAPQPPPLQHPLAITPTSTHPPT